jgi:hypothetical protein
MRQALLLAPLAPLAASLLVVALMGALAEVQVLTKVFVNKPHSLVHLENQATASASQTVPKLALHALIDYQLHAKP